MSDNRKFFDLHEKQTAFKRVSAYVVTHPKKPGKYALVNVAFPADGAGRLTVFVKDFFTNGAGRFSVATAGGYGYDKLTAALSRTDGIDGVMLYDHCGGDVKKSAEFKALNAARKRIVKHADKHGLDSYYINTAVSEKSLKLGLSWNGESFATGLDRLARMGYSVIQAV